MRLLTRLFEPKPQSQAHIVRRAAAVIDHVIFDVGVETLVGGTFLLDNRFRLRFVSVAPPRAQGVIARVQVRQMAEAHLFAGLGATAPADIELLKAHSAALAQAVVRELGAQSAALRALPALPG